MGPIVLGDLSWNGPNVVFEIDVGPFHAGDFTPSLACDE